MSRNNPKIYEHNTLSGSGNGKIDSAEISNEFDIYSRLAESSKKVIGDFSRRNIHAWRNDIYNSGNNVGIIRINRDVTIELRPKLDKPFGEENFWRFMPHMLETLSDYKNFSDKVFLDPDQKIVLPEGANIVSLLTLSFVSLLEKVLTKGLLKRYIRKTERVRSVKGRVDFGELSKKRGWDYSSLPCSYYNLTFDNPENRIILWCCSRLLRNIRKAAGRMKGKSSYIGRRLREYNVLLTEEITLTPQDMNSFRRLNLSGIASHYTDIMNICRAILSEKLFNFDKSGRTNTGINFIIDMDWVFEQYMTHIFKSVAEESFKDKIKIISQVKRKLGDMGNIKIVPDIVIESIELNNKTGTFKSKTLAVLDFKWKLNNKDVHADFYQVISYSLALIYETEKIKAILYSVNKEPITGDGHFETISKAINENGLKSVSIHKIPLPATLLSEGNAQEIEGRIKNAVKEVLEGIITSN